jgi:DivIVA domain-containing protein
MPLTPEDVSNKRFTPVRLREGYDMGEVDSFLDEVEAELARLTKENDELRNKLAAAQQAGGGAPSFAQPEPEPYVAAPPEPEPEPEPEPIQAVAPVAESPIETIRVETVPEASNAAARLLELATRNADELVEDAKNEADKIIGEARTKAERLESEAQTNADRLEADARSRAQMLDSETAQKRQILFGDLEKEQEKLNAEVENLRQFEREYRSRLRSYFSQQLELLNPGESSAPMGEEHPQPKRLRSILGEDDG